MKDNLTRFDFPVTVSIEAHDRDSALAWLHESVGEYADPTNAGTLAREGYGIEGVSFALGITDDALKASNVMTYTNADEGITRDGVVPVIGLDKVADDSLKREAVEA